MPPDEDATHWKRLQILGYIEGKRIQGQRMWDGWMAFHVCGHEFEQVPAEETQRSLACCHPWGHKESDLSEQQ